MLPAPNSKTFSLLQKEAFTPPPNENFTGYSHDPSPSPGPGPHGATSCVYGFACSTYVISRYGISQPVAPVSGLLPRAPWVEVHSCLSRCRQYFVPSYPGMQFHGTDRPGVVSHSSDGGLGCFHGLAAASDAAVNNCVQGSVGTRVCHSPGSTP